VRDSSSRVNIARAERLVWRHSEGDWDDRRIGGSIRPADWDQLFGTNKVEMTRRREQEAERVQ